MSRKSSGTTFGPTGTISGPISSSEPSIHVPGTPFDRFRGYFQNLSQKSCGLESLSVKVCPARCLAQVSLGVNVSKNGSKGRNNDQFWAHRAHEVPCVHTEPFSGSQSQKLTKISIFSDFFFSGGFSRKPHGVTVRDLCRRTHLILFLDLGTIFPTRFMVQNHRIQRIILSEENSEGSLTAAVMYNGIYNKPI